MKMIGATVRALLLNISRVIYIIAYHSMLFRTFKPLIKYVKIRVFYLPYFEATVLETL